MTSHVLNDLHPSDMTIFSSHVAGGLKTNRVAMWLGFSTKSTLSTEPPASPLPEYFKAEICFVITFISFLVLYTHMMVTVVL